MRRQAGCTSPGGGCTAGSSCRAEVPVVGGGTTAGGQALASKDERRGPSGCTGRRAGSIGLLGVTGTSGAVPALLRLITEWWPVVGR